MFSEHEIKTVFMGFLLLLLAGFLCTVTANPAAAKPNKRLQPPSSFLGPDGKGDIYVGGFLQGGGAFKYDTVHSGYGGQLIFRPSAAADFLPFLYNWNCGGVLQIENQTLGPNMGLLSADGILRRYTDDVRNPENTGSTFVGVGVGATRVDPPAGYRGSSVKYWSVLLEAGREWQVRREYLLWVRAQYRHYNWAGVDYRNWTLQVGAGMPWPF